jgi:hypothetical protein
VDKPDESETVQASPDFSEPSGWFDDVAFAAGQGPSPIIIAVCRDLHQASELQTWLRSTIPAMAVMTVQEVHAKDLLGVLAQESNARTTWIVTDAAEGNDAQLTETWRVWNSARDILRSHLLVQPARPHCLVFLVTVTRMSLIAGQAQDLLSVAEIMTVDEEPFAVSAQDRALIEVYQRIIEQLEKKHSLSTEELQNRLFDRSPLPKSLSQTDLNRWKVAAEALRKL